MRCVSLTTSGEPCRNHAMRSGYCAGHDPLRREFRGRRQSCKVLGLPVPAELQHEAGLTPERMEIAAERQECAFDEQMSDFADRLKQAVERIDAGGPLQFDSSGLLPPSKKPVKRKKKWRKWRRP